MFGFKRQRSWQSGGTESAAPVRQVMQAGAPRDPIATAWGVRILPPRTDGSGVELGERSILHVAAQYLSEGRAQVAEYAANASAAVRELLAEARARRFEAVQQAKARRILLENYQAALKRHATAQEILGPHVRFSGSTGKNLWILLFLIGDAAGMTLALTYGGESPAIAATMALAVGAAVIVSGKMGEDLKRESFMKNFEYEGDPESGRVVNAVFGLQEGSRVLNRRVFYAFIGASSMAGVAITIYRSVEENFAVGIAFGFWAMLVGAGSFAASWYYYDPARTYIALTQYAIDDAESIWLDTDIDAVEDHNASVEAARHIVNEHRQRAEAAWSIALAAAAAAMAANSDTIGVAQNDGHWLLDQKMPEVFWPDMDEYQQILDRDDVFPEEPEPSVPDVDPLGEFPLFAPDGTNQIVRPIVTPHDELSN
jgi:hypothetical protein